MVIDYFVYALVGKLLIYLIQQFPLTDKISAKHPTLEKLFACDLCLGVWVYWAVAVIFRQNLFSSIPSPFGATWYMIEYFMTGAITSFIMHLITLGWNSKFQIYEVK